MAFEDIRFPGSKNGKEEVPMMRRVAGGNIWPYFQDLQDWFL